MSLKELLFGRPLADDEAHVERIGPLQGVPVLGLDALASAAYGPEVALTVLMALGAGLLVILRAFANGCTAMTGVEAVSNAVPIFVEPRTRAARRTLTIIVAVLVGLLAGIAFVSQAYGIGATPPGREGTRASSRRSSLPSQGEGRTTT